MHGRTVVVVKWRYGYPLTSMPLVRLCPLLWHQKAKFLLRTWSKPSMPSTTGCCRETSLTAPLLTTIGGLKKEQQNGFRTPSTLPKPFRVQPYTGMTMLPGVDAAFRNGGSYTTKTAQTNGLRLSRQANTEQRKVWAMK